MQLCTKAGAMVMKKKDRGGKEEGEAKRERVVDADLEGGNGRMW